MGEGQGQVGRKKGTTIASPCAVYLFLSSGENDEEYFVKKKRLSFCIGHKPAEKKKKKKPACGASTGMHTPCLTNQSYFLYSVDVLRALACRFIPHTWAGIFESWEGRLNIFTIRWLYSPVAVYSIKERGGKRAIDSIIIRRCVYSWKSQGCVPPCAYARLKLWGWYRLPIERLRQSWHGSGTVDRGFQLTLFLIRASLSIVVSPEFMLRKCWVVVPPLGGGPLPPCYLPDSSMQALMKYLRSILLSHMKLHF